METPRTLAGSRRIEQRLYFLAPRFNDLFDAIDELDDCWQAMEALIDLIQPAYTEHSDDLAHVDRRNLAALLRALNNYYACVIEDIREARAEFVSEKKHA
jgi:hypothetical protein